MVITQTLLDFMRSLFGTYVPVSYTDSSGVSVVPPGMSGVNFEYVAQVVIFSLCVYFLFRIFASLLSPRR